MSQHKGAKGGLGRTPPKKGPYCWGQRSSHTLGSEKESRIIRPQGDAMSTVPPEELAARQAQEARYHAQRRIDQIGDLVRGMEIAMRVLSKECNALLAEKAGLEGEGNGK